MDDQVPMLASIWNEAAAALQDVRVSCELLERVPGTSAKLLVFPCTVPHVAALRADTNQTRSARGQHSRSSSKSFLRHVRRLRLASAVFRVVADPV